MCDQTSNKPHEKNILNKVRVIHPAWVVMLGCCFLQAGGVGAVMVSQGVFYVPVCNELGFSRSEFSLWVSIHSLLGVFFLPLAGKLYARYDFRVVLGVSTVACAAAAALMGTYCELWQFYVSGAIFGIFGMAVWQLPYSTLISEWFDDRVGIAMSVPACAAALSGALLAPLFNIVIESYGWRCAYYLQGTIVAASILPWVLFVFRLKPKDLGLSPYQNATNREKAMNDKECGRHTKVAIRKKMFTLTFLLLFLFSGIGSMLGSGYDSHLPGIGMSYGLTAASAALLVTALQLGSFVSKIATGMLNDHIGVKKTIYLELLVVALSLIGLVATRGTWGMFIAAFFFGTQDTIGGVSAPLLLRELFGRDDYVEMNAWMRVGFSLFGAFAPPVVGLAYDMTGSFDPAMVGGVAMSAIGAAIVFLAYKTAGSEKGLQQ